MKSAIRNYALLFACCLLFHLAGTWSLPLIDRDEPRFAEASREMIERADYVVPYFNNQFRFDKPPLTYWMQVASYRIFGENDFAARFPSAVAAALTALSIFACGSRIGGNRVGWSAAIIFTLSFQTAMHAKAAVADMWLVLFMTSAYWAGHELFAEKKTQWKWWFVFYISLALAFLAKGPIGWLPLVTIVATKLFDHHLEIQKRFRFFRGILLMLVIVSLWGVPALIRTDGEFFRVGIMHHVVGRSFNAMEGHGSNSLWVYLLLLPFYFVTIFLTFFPWSFKLPWLARKLWGNWRAGITDPGYSSDKIDIYLIAGIGVIFVIFSLLKTKLPHYTLPAFPLLALLLARHWNLEGTAASQPLKKVAIVTACFFAGIALIAPPFVAKSFPAYALFQASRDSLRPKMEFGAVDYNEPSLVWYFRSRVKGFLTPLKKREATEFMARPGPRFVVVPTLLAGVLFADHPADWRIFSTHGFNIPKGKSTDLTLILKPE